MGRAIRESGLPRKEIFVTSKLWLQDHGYEAARKGIDASLKKLGLDYIDLYLIHQLWGCSWCVESHGRRPKGWEIRSIGVSNMSPKIWNQFVPQFEVKPSVNQVEFNPYFQQKIAGTSQGNGNGS